VRYSKAMKILLIGPFPDPVNGISIAFAKEKFRLDIFGEKIYQILKEACRI
jgi:hypothetical protein